MIKNYSSKVYDRLKNLYFNLGLEVCDGNDADAEIYAISKAIENVNHIIGNIQGKIICDNVDNYDMYIDLLNIDKTNKSDIELLDEIKEKLSMQYGQFNRHLYDKELAESGCRYKILGRTVKFQKMAREKLPKLHKFIDSYLAYFNMYTFYSESKRLNFDRWDALKNNCAYYDSLQLCWAFLDNYREDVNV